jgi:hypothetical protein
VQLKTLQGVQELGESFADSKTEAEEGRRSHTCSETQIRGVRGDEAKVEAFEKANSSKVGKKAQKLRRSRDSRSISKRRDLDH